MRIWRGEDGRYAHHLLDPATGEPAWTGLIGATALGDTAVEAETFAKAALLSGPEGGREVLAERGGLMVHDSGRVETVGPLSARPRIRLPTWRASGDERRRAAETLQTHGWWLASRASGLVALVLVTISVGLGLTMAGKLMRRPGLSRKLLAIHEQTALAGHRRDRRPRHHPARRPLAPPRARRHRRPLHDGLPARSGPASASSPATSPRCSGSASTSAGGSAPRLWRKAHRATVVVYLLGLVHALGAGTDASAVWFRWWVMVTAPVDRRPLRLPRPRRRAKRPRAARAAPAPASRRARRPIPATVPSSRRHDGRPRSS